MRFWRRKVFRAANACRWFRIGPAASRRVGGFLTIVRAAGLTDLSGKGAELKYEFGRLEQQIHRAPHEVTTGCHVDAAGAQNLAWHAKFVVSGCHEPAIVLDDVQHLAKELDAANGDV
jgi:hypothetical protein